MKYHHRAPGKSLDNSQGNIVDLIYQNSLSSNLALVELKTPQTPLIGSKYRNTYTLSKEVIGAVNQLLKYKDSIYKNWFSLVIPSQKMKNVFSPKCLLITGNMEDINEEQQVTVELFRNELRSVEIVTYSELFKKIEHVLSLIKEVELEA